MRDPMHRSIRREIALTDETEARRARMAALAAGLRAATAEAAARRAVRLRGQIDAAGYGPAMSAEAFSLALDRWDCLAPWRETAASRQTRAE